MENLTHAQLLSFSAVKQTGNRAGCFYTHIETDSRKIDASGVFFALPGVASHGWDYLDKVASLGGRVAVVPRHLKLSHPIIELIHVDEPASVLIKCLHHMVGLPPKRLVAVTGTNGKSSICFYLTQMAQAAGFSSGLIGTFGVGPLDQLQEARQTTPDLLAMHQLLSQMAEQGVDFVAFEASSHALDQGRLYGVPFQTAVFSNLSRDHLDYHGTMEAYAQAKRRLFSFPSVEQAVLCLDDPQAAFMAEVVSDQVNTFYYSESNEKADFYVRDLQFHPAGCEFILCHPEGQALVFLPLLGRFNIQNALAALASLWPFFEDKSLLIAALQGLKGAPGRMEKVSTEALLDATNRPTVVVDYAHTPDALKVALTALKEHSSGRVVCVFGCGGDRDRGKRPIMLSTALQYADDVWLTSDNPRTESPEQILRDAAEGVSEQAVYQVEVDRRVAITKAIASANSKDIVLIAGKGHETYQDIQGVKHHFDDKEEALKGLASC
ncbi:UDP-N-acetylmuramoyl-L-alanyl-D-glutamate--2,6-diaminopimelate ligase [Marinomonas spartinae]|uniref:UDP-N-acetylmuramoyl-L-alanyl-D-glutamate--2, 6-diaminopimelate ligase n=1 Tax=Marinomonas spartinae TaxID=1792290 RepID=UPI0018F11A4D|nr:UDP-N-acetylmuramoyl-L-alanyl-D-glutamate--2,6-diaminopimelate ligase [Marinomonas spartinae]MBJ7553270.1 UDP-N-acetylmuramoyl-L-alanyl-D-glutamate--2,6-diaminopimelate ligase [Marinomonas spartinae]